MKYGRLTIVGRERRDGRTFWSCRCDCGNLKSIYADSIKKGVTQSCGCLRKQVSAERSTTHGMDGTPELKAWKQMRVRCRPENKDHSFYADKGVQVCLRWQESFENFFADMGSRPSALHSLDRKDNNGIYEPDNCHWATKAFQSQNSKQSKIWVVFGEKFASASIAAKVFGVTRSTIKHWCNGVNNSPYFYPPKAGCYSYMRYGSTEK